MVNEDEGVLCAAPRLGVTERNPRAGRPDQYINLGVLLLSPYGPLLGAALWVSWLIRLGISTWEGECCISHAGRSYI